MKSSGLVCSWGNGSGLDELEHTSLRHCPCLSQRNSDHFFVDADCCPEAQVVELDVIYLFEEVRCTEHCQMYHSYLHSGM